MFCGMCHYLIEVPITTCSLSQGLLHLALRLAKLQHLLNHADSGENQLEPIKHTDRCRCLCTPTPYSIGWHNSRLVTESDYRMAFLSQCPVRKIRRLFMLIILRIRALETA
ncbi:hypothetical protein AcW1_009366 [Taiwanofungus camphoratus]|nr:hypothetical protein AcW1_009366 [Antrodia cinnamomea]